MSNFINYFLLREIGLTKSAKFAKCENSIENLLEQEAARPQLYNKVRLTVIVYF